MPKNVKYSVSIVHCRSGVSATRWLFTPLKQDIETESEQRKQLYGELKSTMSNGCFTSFFEKGSAAQQKSNMLVAHLKPRMLILTLT